MADEDLVVKAKIDDELSAPLENIREDLGRVGDEAERSGTRASRASRGWATFGRVAKRALLGLAAGAAAAGYGAYRLMKSSISEASTLTESLNAVNVVYGKQAKAVKKLGREAAEAIGLSNVQFNGLAVQFSSFAQAVGGPGKGSVRVLDDLTTRAADFASVMNIEVAEAAELFQSGLAGESEPLRKYGINLSAAAVGAYAVKAGLSESATEMTDAAKVQATYGLLMEKTAVTQGDFTNTSDSLANQQRILSARFDNTKAKLGKTLLPMMQTVVSWLNREGIPAFERFADWFGETGLPALKRFGERARDLATEYLPKVKDALADVKDVAVVAAEAGRELVDAFLGMPSWARKLLIGGAAGGAVAAKLGLPKILTTATGLATKAKPLPVWVVNNGLPGDGPGVGPDGKPKPTSKLSPKALGLSFIKGLGLPAVAAVGTDVTRRVLSAGVGDENASKIQTTASTAGGAGMGSPFSSDYFRDTDKAEKKIDQYATSLDAARAKAAGFGTELDLVGRRKVNPTIDTGSIQNATNRLGTFLSKQIDAGRPITPYITLNGYERAMGQIATLTTAIHSIPTAGVDNGLTYASGGTPTDTPRRNREFGGSVKAGEPYVVGERRAEWFVPNRSGTIIPRVEGRTGGTGGGAVTIERDAIRVNVNNPAANVDVERAVADGIEAWFRNRRERR